MDSKVSGDIVSLFKGLITELKPYANQQGVRLSFKSSVGSLQNFYTSEEVVSQFSKVISKVVSYTPQSHMVSVHFEDIKEEGGVRLIISNTGADLRRIREITNSLTYVVEVNSQKNKGTTFKIKLPRIIENTREKLNGSNSGNNLGYTPYYIEIEKRLSTYFSDIDNLQKAADKKNSKSGLFLQKVNETIQSRKIGSFLK